MSTFKKSTLSILALLLLVATKQSNAQCYNPTSYCTNITASNYGGFGMGLQNVRFDTLAVPVQINNSTGLGNGAQIYFDFTSQRFVARSGATVFYSVTGGNSNQTKINIYIDLDNNGVFGATAPEMVANVPNMTVANTTTTGSFVLPAMSPGVYRVRVASDGQGITPPPCGPSFYSADYEDYTMFIASPTMDVTIGTIPSPTFFLTGNNAVGVRFTNPSNATMNTIDIGYQLGTNTPVTQTLTGLGLAPGATYTGSFTTPLNIATTGSYSIKVWATNPNGTGSATPADDTTCRSFTVYCSGPLSGNYTINKTGSGPTNFTSFGQADSNLITCGISGPVTFTVSADTFDEQVWIPAISGSSSTNRITFNGAGAANTMIRFNTTTTNPHIVRFDGCSFVTFRNMTLRSTTTTNQAQVVQFVNGLSNRVNNCIIEMTGAAATSGSSTLYGVVNSGSASSPTTNSTGNGHTIDSCVINNGYYAVSSYCANSTSTFNFLYNTINNPFYYGFYFSNNHVAKINFNTINMRTTNNFNMGIFMINCNAGTGVFHEIRNNFINNSGQYGMYFLTSNGSGNLNGQIYNNMITGFRATNGVYGINDNSTRWQIWHNNININNNQTSGTSACVYINGGSLHDIRNNHLTVSSTSSVGTTPLYLSSTAAVNALDYNNFQNKTNSNIVAGALSLNTSNYRVAFPTGAGANSTNQDPQYTNPSSDLHVGNGCLTGVNLGVTTDIDNQPRSSTPDVGADEANPVLNTDMSILTLNTPAFPLTLGSKTINVTLKNLGLNTITSVDINYSVNGGGVVTQSLTGLSIAACDTYNVSFTTPYVVTGPSNFLVYTSNPNGTTDLNTANDTLARNLCVAMSGVYTIDPAGAGPTNYTSFAAAITDLNCGGISGPVTFNVAANSYYEQVTVGNVPGTSAVNTITFDGGNGNAATRILSFNATSAAAPHTFRMNGSSFVNLRNMTIRSTNGANGWPVHIMEGTNCTVRQCNIYVDSLGTTAIGSNLAAVVMNGSATSITTASSTINNLFIDSNNIRGGYYGIASQSASQATTANTLYMRNNNIDSSYFYGIYFGNNTVKISWNNINMRFITANNSVGIYTGSVQSNTALFCEITNNKIFGIGQYGMQLSNFYGSGANHRVNNNFIGRFRGTGAIACFGMDFNFSYSLDVYHNTINVDNATTGGNRALRIANVSSPINIRNNIFAINNAGATSATPIQFTSSVTPTLTNNAYWNLANTNIIQTTSGTFTTAALNTAYPLGAGSANINVDPQFPSATDLHLGAGVVHTAFNSSLNLLATVPTDIDNQPRLTTPDRGADEKVDNNVGISAILAPTSVTPGVYSIQVRIRNYGSNAVSNIPVRYSLNGGAAVAETYVPSIPANDSATYTFTTTATFLACNTLRTFTALAGDASALDDSTNRNIGALISGAYTINPSGSGPTNFTNFTNAINFLNCGVITGPVTFDVSAATYAEQITIPSTFIGVSATNTITFDGGNGNAATRIIQFATSASPNFHVVRFNGCSFVTFRNITIRNTATSGGAWAAHFVNGTNNRLNNCIVELVGFPLGNSNYSPIVINNSTTTISTSTTTANNIMVDSCVLNGGYYNIYTSASGGGNNTFRFFNNTLNNAYQYSANFNNSHVVKFNNNTVNFSTSLTSNIGVYIVNNNLSGLFFHEINGNRFTNTGQAGILMSSASGSSSIQSQCYNNFINGFRYTFGIYGIQNNSCSNWNYYHNTINLDVNSTSGTSACLFLNGPSNCDVRNNIFSITNPLIANAFPLYLGSTSNVSSLDNNNYYRVSGTSLVYFGGPSLTASNYKLSFPIGAGLNSISTNPSFVSASNLHVTNACNNGVNLGVTTDIDGDTRAGLPDMGADEVTSVPNDEIQVNSITAPGFPLVAGSQPVTVVIKNNGNNTVSSFNVNYRLNNGTVVTEAYAGAPIAPCATANFTFATNVTIINGLNSLKVYTTLPNGNTDAIPSNDTAQFSICTVMSGTFTIDPAGSGPSNFTSFTNAVNSLICAGVNGAVTFNVANGIFTEQITIPSIQGASATNFIRFQSATASANACTLTFTPSSAGSHTIFLDGADYITFDKITIANGYTASTVYTTRLANGADFNTFSNCIFNNPINQNAYAVFQNNTTDKNNTWTGNTINNGGYGLFLQSNTSILSTRNTILNNIFNNQTGTGTTYAIYSYYQDSVTITGNTISTNQSTGSYYGISSQWNGKLPIITKNKITGINLTSGSAYGISTSGFANNGFSFGRGLIANNFIQLGGGATTNWGIQFQSSSNYTDIMHNSINMTSTLLSTNVGGLFYGTSLTGNTIQNNIIQASGNGTTSCAVANIGTSGTSGCVFNNNNFFGRNATFGYCGSANGTTTASYAAFKAGGAAISNFESAGVNKEVSFNSTTDLHTTTPCIANAGANVLSIVSDDIDGQARTSTPDIGADEYTANAYDVTTQALVSPAGSVFATGTPYTVRVRVRNNGSATITDLDLNYSINGVVTSQTFSGLSLAACDTISLVFTAPLTLTSSGSNVFRAYNGLINTSNADQNNANDTLLVNMCTPYNGEYVINKNLPFSTTNFPSVAQALASMYSCGVSGPVKLRIAAGTGPYNEQITLTGVAPGASRTNTITLTGGPTREAITFNPTSSAAQHTIRLITTKHIILDSLTINNTGASFGVGVHLVTAADSNAVRNSIINISLASTSFSNSAGIAISSNAASVTGTGNNGNRNIIDNNQINGGYYGITGIGSNSTTFCRYNEITRNRLNGQAYYGIYYYYQAQTKVTANTVDNMLASNTFSYAMIFTNIDSFEINKNVINRFGQYAMYFNGMNHIGGTGTYRSQIVNNMIGGMAYNSNPYGMYFQIGAAPATYRNVDFWHNTIHLNNVGGGYAHFFQNTSASTSISGLDYRNNTMTATNNSGIIAYFYWNNLGTPFTTFAKNNINSLTSPTGSYILMNNTTTTGNAWISASFGTINTSTCLAVDPLFINYNTNLHALSNPLSNNGVNIPAITDDIDGDTRPLAPSLTVDIGSDEFNVPALNTGVTAVVNPVAPMTVGLQDVTVQIRNFGTATLTSANVSYKVGVNGTPKTIAWTGSLVNNATTNVTFTGANQYNFTGSYDTVIAWTDGPNGGLDEYLPNDTFVNSVVCQPLSGTYTLDNSLPASASNFTNFTSLATALNNCGVTGPVTINVAANTYTEQFELKQFPGASATNTVTIQSASGVATSVNLQFNTATLAANNYVVLMNGSDYVSFRNMSMTNTNTGIGSYVIWQTNNSRFNTFQNVVFNGSITGSTSTNYAIVYANNPSLVNAGQGDDNNTFNACTFNNGSYGIYYNGTYGSTYSNNTVITNNTFTNQSYMGIYLYFHFNFNVSNNVITTNSINTCYGFYFYGGGVSNSGSTILSKNRIDIANSGYGMFLQYLVGNNTIVSNNMIRVGSASNTAYAMYSQYSACKIYNNTLVTSSGNTTNAAAYIFNTAYTPATDFRYNIVVNRGNGSSAGYAAYYYYPGTGGLTYMLIDSNVYFCGTGATNQIVHYNSSLGTTNNFATYAAWRTYISGLLGATNTDQNSLYTSPSFVSASDLHISTGTNVMNIPANALVPDDIDNTPRCGTNTDVGADHHPQNNDIGVTAVVYPPNGVAALGSQTIRVLIRNFGGNPVTSANVSYDINGTVVTQAWTGTLNTCDTTTVVFTTPYTFVPGTFSMKAYTDGPNGAVDTRLTNDTLSVNGCIGMGGAYTINAGAPPSATNFQTFGAAVAAMTGCGVTSPTVFTVAAGNYVEQVTIPLISGSSSVNTITFDGGAGNAATRVLKFATSSGSPFVVRLNTTSNVYFRNLTIQTTDANNAWNVHFLNSNNCGVAQCIINDSLNQYNTSNNVHRVLVNGSLATPTASSAVSNNIYIDSNDIGYGYYSVVSAVNNALNTTYIRGNTFSSTSSSWIYAINNHCLKIKYNYFRTNSPVLSAYLPNSGILLNSATPNAALFHEISYNRMDSILGYFVQIASSNGNPTNYAQFYNNMISGSYYQVGGHHPVFGNNNSFWKYYHNSINLNLSANHTAYPLFQSGGANNEARNNILAVTDAAQAGSAPLGASSGTVFSAVDNNILYNTASANLLRIGVTNYTAANHNSAAWPSAAGLGSRNFDPKFVSAEDLHVNSSVRCRLLSPNVGVTTDIDNQARGLFTSSGGDEVVGVNNDLSIDAITVPSTTSITAGNAPLSVVVRNSGSNTITSGNISYSLNGAAAVTTTLPSSLAPCDTITVTFASVPFASGTNNVTVYTDGPNGGVDANTSNDTLRNLYCTLLSGNYTVDKTQPASATNFVSLTSAISALYSCGLSGPVNIVINSGTGPYNEQLTFNGVVPGSSRINTVTIDGSASKETVQYNGASASLSPVFRLNGAKFITLKNMTINTLNVNWGIGVQMANGSDSNVVDGNVINMTGTSDTRNAGITLSAIGTTALLAGNNGSYNIIRNNSINNGAYGIVAVGVSSAVFNRANQFLNNTVRNAFTNGFNMQFQDSARINGNDIEMTNANPNSYGMFMSYMDRFQVNKNKVNKCGQAGIFFNQFTNYNFGAVTTDSAEVSNNMIGGIFYGTGTVYGLYFGSNYLRNVNIYNNSISVNTSVPQFTYGLYMQYSSNGFYSNNKVVNNNVVVYNSTGYAAYLFYGAGFTPATPFAMFDYNNFLNTDLSANQTLIGTTSYGYSSPTSPWVGVGGFNTNSKSLDPNYLNPLTNLHMVHPNLDSMGISIAQVTDDIDGNPRNATKPDIGADEFDVPAENIGAFSIISPTYPLTTGLQDVTVQIKNFGTVTITSATVKYKVGNAGTVKTTSWTGTLAVGATTNVNFTGANQYNFAGGYDTVIAWTENPNGVADGYAANDTTRSTTCSPLNGTYTLDAGLPASISNFTSFAQLRDRLNTCGVSGPVTINVDTAIINEQVVFTQYPGASVSNRVTIQSAGGNPATVTWQFLTAGGTNNYIVHLDGADYMAFKNITFNTSSNLAFSTAVRFGNAAIGNEFTGNIFNGNSATLTNINQALISNYTNSLAQSDDNTVFSKNTFISGTYGIYSVASTQLKNSWIIDSNTFADQYQYRIFMISHRNSLITNNVMTTAIPYTAAFGIYLQNCVSNGANFTVAKNKVSGIAANYGMYFTNCSGTLANPFLVMNNFVQVGSGTNTAYPMFFTGCYGTKVFHNSLNLTSSNGNAFYWNYTTTAPLSEVKYNVIANTGTGTAAPYAININMATPGATYMRMDSNVYFQGTGALGFSQGSYTTATLAAWKVAALLLDANSITTPTFPYVSSTNLHLTSPVNLYNIITNPLVPDDIDGTIRSGITDAGADHHPVTVDAGVSSIVYPSGGVASPGLQNIVVVVKNYGASNLTSANVSYNINGTVQTKLWTGNLATGASDTVTFSGAQQYNFTVGFTMKAYTDSPNVVPDPLNTNDTAYTTGCLGMAGNYTIDPLGGGLPNFTSFANAIAGMQSCGISGPVVFQVAAGTYREQVNIPLISGSSPTNTITFDGGTGNASTRIIQWPGTLASPSIVLFNTTSNVTVKNMTISASSADNHYNVNFFNSSNCKLIGCILTDSSNVSDPATSFNSFRVLLSGSATSNTTGTINNNIYIDSNITNNGHYAIYSSMNNGLNTVYIRNNTINNPSMGIMNINGAQTIKLIGNTFRPKFRGSNWNPQQGVYFNNASPAGTNFHEIRNNISDSTYGYGYQLVNSSGSVIGYNIFANNVVYGIRYSGMSAVYNTGSYWKIYHNSIAMDFNSAHTAYCYQQVSGTNGTIDIRNNNFAVTNSNQTGAMPVSISSTAIVSNFDFNNLYNAASASDLLRIGVTNTGASAAYPSGIGVNSKNINPLFLGVTNLHIPSSMACVLRGQSGLGITTDMDNQTRAATPIIGADEIFANTDDISVQAITSPSSSIAAGSYNVVVLLKNVGNNTINSANISYKLNGGSAVSITLPAPLNACDTVSVVFTGVTFGSGSNSFVTYTSLPNGNTDADFSNDTIKTNFCTPLNGTYTVGGVAPDYATFIEAVNALNCGGVSGPVVFNVRNGVYNEFIQINPIAGSSVTNKVTFQSESGIASAVTIQNNTTPGFTIKVLNADNIVFRDMTIRAGVSNTNTIQIIALGDSCTNISIYNNIISSQWSTSFNQAAIYSSGKVPNLMIRKNVITNAAYAVYALGVSGFANYPIGIRIDSNTINNSGGSDAFAVFHVQFYKAPVIKYNNILKTGCCADQGFTLFNIGNGGEISYNKLITSFGMTYAMSIQNVNVNGETTPLYIYNNFITHGPNGGSNILMNATNNYVYFYNNSLNHTNPSGSYNLYINNASGLNSNIRIVNNSFKTPSGIQSLFLTGTALATTRSMIAECDYNNYFQGTGAASENILSLQGVNYTNTTMKGAIYTTSPRNDTNSFFYNPQYVSNTNLHILATSQLDGKGKTISLFTDDIDGQSRLTSSYDIGADDTSLIRKTVGDFVKSSGCIPVSGSSWIDVTDSTGKLVFSINPEGNNLGTVCWGVRISNGPLRTDSVYNSTDGIKYYSMFLDRNIYINPSIQPAAGTNVSIKMYVAAAEWQKLADSAMTYGITLNAYYTKIHRYHEAAGTTSLTPLTAQPVSGDSSQFLYTLSVSDYANEKRLQFRTSHFSQFNPLFVPNVPPLLLPVTWLDFNAKVKDRNTILDWSTASEKNSDMFEVERSNDGKEFESIGKVKAAGNSATVKLYNFVDKNSAGLGFDKLYYRIKQIDKDGQTDYSKTRAVSFIADESIVLHYVGPNPFKTELHVDFSLPKADKASITLYDVNGKQIMNTDINGVKGDNAHSLKVGNIAAGIYFLKIKSGEQSYTEKVVKQD